VVPHWNSLPEYVVTAPSTNTFKNRLDKHWQIWAIKALLLSSSTYKYKYGFKIRMKPGSTTAVRSNLERLRCANYYRPGQQTVKYPVVPVPLNGLIHGGIRPMSHVQLYRVTLSQLVFRDKVARVTRRVAQPFNSRATLSE